MRNAYLSVAVLLVFAATSVAGDSVINDIVDVVKEAFTPEGTFNADARGKLLEANDMIVDFLDKGEYCDEEYMGAMSLQSLVMYNLACLDAIDGEIEGAFVWLEGAVSSGYTDAEWMAEDADLEPLRSDARFDELLDEAITAQIEMESCWEESHSCLGDDCTDCGGSCH
jgi:hypothetical protein